MRDVIKVLAKSLNYPQVDGKPLVEGKTALCLAVESAEAIHTLKSEVIRLQKLLHSSAIVPIDNQQIKG